MANSYAMNAGNMYSQGGGYQPVRKNSGPSVFGMMTLGALGGGTAGYFRTGILLVRTESCLIVLQEKFLIKI